MGMLATAIAIARNHVARADADDLRVAANRRPNRMEGRPGIFEVLHDMRSADRPDLAGACRRLGIEVEFRCLPDGMAGWIESDAARFVVDIESSEIKRRLILAHQLAHWLYDRGAMRAGGGLNDRHGFGSMPGAPFHNPGIDAEAETRANRMAVQLLMPGDIVRRLSKAGMTTKQVAERMGTTTRAMEIRYGTLGLASSPVA